jgi:hypothetical protein
MKLIKVFVISVSICSLSMLIGIHPVFSQEMSNHELEQEIKALKEKIEGKDIRGLGGLAEKLTFSGAIELDYTYADDSDIEQTTVDDSTSDLDIGTVELGLEAAFHEYVTGFFLIKGEDLDDDSDIFCDEATITIQKEGFPLYFVGGKRGQPFGLFENHLINDPLTQDCYEIVESGATIGYATDLLDVSFTIHKGEELMGHLVEAGYGFERKHQVTYEETDDVDSYIGNITIFPLEGLRVAAYYGSEPGDGERNETVGGSIHYELSRLTLDGEYITAVQREKHYGDNKEYKESAWFISAAFQVIEPLEIAARYEGFDDDKGGDQAGHLEDRFSIGCTYTLFEKEDFAANIMGEYRRSGYENEPGSDDELNEAFLRLAIEF